MHRVVLSVFTRILHKSIKKLKIKKIKIQKFLPLLFNNMFFVSTNNTLNNNKFQNFETTKSVSPFTEFSLK